MVEVEAGEAERQAMVGRNLYHLPSANSSSGEPVTVAASADFVMKRTRCTMHLSTKLMMACGQR